MTTAGYSVRIVARVVVTSVEIVQLHGPEGYPRSGDELERHMADARMRARAKVLAHCREVSDRDVEEKLELQERYSA